MAMTPDEERKQQDDFSNAFENDSYGAQEEPAMEQAEEPAVAQAEAQGGAEGAPADVESEVPAEPGEAMPTEAAESGGGSAAEAAPAVAIVIEPGAEESGSVDEQSTDPKDIAREKSWEGRLKAREAELAKREAALAEKEKQAPADMPADSPAELAAEGETPAEEAAETPQAEALEDVSEAVASGEMTPEEAMKVLSQDFGEEFTKMLGVMIKASATEIASQLAEEKMGPMNQNIDALVNEYVSNKARDHYESISEAHEDFMEIAEAPAFKEWIASMPEDMQQKAAGVINSGSSRQIIRMLNAFKQSQQPKPEEVQEMDTPDEGAMDAAEGVRSGGITLPDQPAQNDDYEAAWEKF